MTPQHDRHAMPPGDALSETIDRLKAIAAAAGDTLLLAEGPLHPDWQLLELCSDALHLIRQADKLADEARVPHDGSTWTDATRAHGDALWAEHKQLSNRAGKLMRRAGTLRAATPAGIYAKALLVRSSRTGAAELAKSLADELIACRELRQSLWPAERNEA